MPPHMVSVGRWISGFARTPSRRALAAHGRAAMDSAAAGDWPQAGRGSRSDGRHRRHAAPGARPALAQIRQPPTTSSSGSAAARDTAPGPVRRRRMPGPSYGKAASKSVSGRYPRTPARCRRPRLACWRECSSLDSTCDPLPWGLLPGPRALLETSADRTAPPVASVAVHPWGGCLAQFIRLAGSALHAAQARTTDLAWTFVRTASLGRYLHTQTPPRLPDGEPEGHQQRRRNGSVQGRENAHDV